MVVVEQLSLGTSVRNLLGKMDGVVTLADTDYRIVNISWFLGDGATEARRTYGPDRESLIFLRNVVVVESPVQGREVPFHRTGR
ncbi:hypothetical protein A2160_03465 [Candidatus Beckwithbacteria bacterium RBG_13_42_9]|uniref:Uncharacterized protein n=1 Tax=Candidatus Beckwithbacteria bacterium RBG_13_42_9 TaxID=1797457 RepID=A0A1F5E8Y4_9BACT|nr:MAG: hypothetical protein A2160_03465 [Candidatus Beckwithbacteria bacterium RBG_13_42_9]